jgi:hypothetical protein
MQPPAPIAAAIVALAGCVTERPPSPAVTVVDSAGVTVVMSHEAQWNQGGGWTVPAEPRRVIGVLNGSVEYQFFDVAAASRQADGDVVVADAGSHTVRLYSSDGVFKRLLGGAGSGPGEFQRPTQILVRASDSIVVWDDAAYRITKYDSAGTFVGAHTLSRATVAKAVTPPLYPGSTLLLCSGELLIRLIEKSRDSPTASRFRQRSGALRVNPDLAAIDTLMLFGDVEQVLVDSPWGPLALVPALAKNTSIAVQPTEPRVCLGEQEGPEVLCFEPDGSTIAPRWLAGPIAVRVDEREVSAWRETTLELYEQKLRPDDARRLVAQIPVPAVRPEYSELLLDREGNLWVKRGPTASGDAESIEYLVFDRQGVMLGSVLLPPMRILEIGTDYVMGVYEDQLEVQYVQILEIVKPTSTSGAS